MSQRARTSLSISGSTSGSISGSTSGSIPGSTSGPTSGPLPGARHGAPTGARSRASGLARRAAVVTAAAGLALAVGAPAASANAGGGSSAPAPPSAATSAAQASATGTGAEVLDVAARYVGTPYVWGGEDPSGFDCSGFVQYVYGQVGVDLPRTAAQQAAAGTVVSRAEARPGDLVVMDGEYHDGIYAGGNQFYDSPKPGDSVSLRDIWTSDVYFVRVA